MAAILSLSSPPLLIVSSHTMYLSISPPDGIHHVITELILGLRPANERRRYFVTTSLIGWAQT